MGKTKIDWCDQVLNPFVGCSKCSPGCHNCYAEKFAVRLAKNPNPKISAKYKDVVDDNGNWTGHISNLDLSCFDKLPKKPSRVFIGSMTDIFHDNMPYEYQMKIMDKICDYQQHTFLLLTKRIKQAQYLFQKLNPYIGFLQNIWLGATVCNQEEADKKIPILLQIPAAKHYVSIEPMLGNIDIRHYLQGENKLDWVIAGGETGKNARPAHETWVKKLRDQCLDKGTPFFFKSWGEWLELEQRNSATAWLTWGDKNILKVGKSKSGHLIDGVEYRHFPEV